MTRTDDDSWDLRCGVGTTATMAAAARAVASRSLDPVIDDPFAEVLVRVTFPAAGRIRRHIWPSVDG